MMSLLNTEWKYSQGDVIFWGSAVVLVGVPFLWGTWQYWAWAFNSIPETATMASQVFQLSLYLVVFSLLLGILAVFATPLGIMLAILSASITLIGKVLYGFYRKICP